MIVFPMAGESRRFREGGYSLPKYMLPLGCGFAFDYSVAGFISAFSDQEFIFVYRERDGTREFLEARTRALALKSARFVELREPTRGQAETVEKGLLSLGASSAEELTIFNIDTFRRQFERPDREARGDGYLEVFRGQGENWSFVEPAEGDERRVTLTTEKVPVSELCCTGLYNFGKLEDFFFALLQERRSPSTTLGELYVAPIYNHLLSKGYDIRYTLIEAENVAFCGVPAEYEELQAQTEFLEQFSWGRCDE